MKKIVIGSDHRGFNLKTKIISSLPFEFIDCGTFTKERCDYTVITKSVINKINNNNFGILICGSGVGVSIMANKFKGIRAALCYNEQIAFQSRQHGDANILCLPADFFNEKDVLNWIMIFLQTNFLNEEPYISRVNQLNEHGENIISI